MLIIQVILMVEIRKKRIFLILFIDLIFLLPFTRIFFNWRINLKYFLNKKIRKSETNTPRRNTPRRKENQPQGNYFDFLNFEEKVIFPEWNYTHQQIEELILKYFLIFFLKNPFFKEKKKKQNKNGIFRNFELPKTPSPFNLQFSNKESSSISVYEYFSGKNFFLFFFFSWI